MPPGQIYTLATLPEKGIEYSHVHLRRMWNDGRFPKPFYLSQRRPAWTEQQLDAWIEEKASKRDARQ